MAPRSDRGPTNGLPVEFALSRPEQATGRSISACHEGAVKVPRPPSPSSPNASNVMRSNRASGTGPEKTILRGLRAAGVTGMRTNMRGLPGRPDIAFPVHRVAVFVHGCFWHQHGCSHSGRLPVSNSEYWRLKFASNRERDARKATELTSAGWTVVTIWECEIAAEPTRCVRRIRAGLRAHSTTRGDR